MGILEIVLLVIGSIIFIISFFIPGKEKELGDNSLKALDRKMDDAMTDKMNHLKNYAEDLIEEGISDSIAKVERGLDRITNEKMSAVQEYSDTVLTQIQKNHEEVIFLYDMLSTKQKELQEIINTINNIDIMSVNSQLTNVNLESSKLNNLNSQKSQVRDSDSNSQLENLSFKGSNEDKTATSEVTRSLGKETVNVQTQSVGNNLSILSTEDIISNNNEKILQLHKQGKSNVAIAKELSLGVGEVKLVIDLFEGIKG